MFQESFEVNVKGKKKISKQKYQQEEDDDNCSDITDDELDVSSEPDADDEILDYLSKAFCDVADVTKLSEGKYLLEFFEQNTKLVDEEHGYDFDIVDGIPYLADTELFIPFVNFMKEFEPDLEGTALYTNLEGGGDLVI